MAESDEAKRLEIERHEAESNKANQFEIERLRAESNKAKKLEVERLEIERNEVKRNEVKRNEVIRNEVKEKEVNKVAEVTLEDMFTESESQWNRNPNYGTAPPAKKSKISTKEAKDGEIIYLFYNATLCILF